MKALETMTIEQLQRVCRAGYMFVRSQPLKLKQLDCTFYTAPSKLELSHN